MHHIKSKSGAMCVIGVHKQSAPSSCKHYISSSDVNATVVGLAGFLTVPLVLFRAFKLLARHSLSRLEGAEKKMQAMIKSRKHEALVCFCILLPCEVNQVFSLMAFFPNGSVQNNRLLYNSTRQVELSDKGKKIKEFC